MNYQCDFISEYMEKKDEFEIDLKEIFYVILKNMKYVIVAALLCAVVAFGYTKFFVTPMYSSSTTVYVLNRSSTSRIDENSLTSSDLQSGALLLSDYVELIQSRSVANAVIQELGLDMSVSKLLSIITVSTNNETRIIRISASYPDAKIARKIANSVRENGAKHIQEVMDIEGLAVSDEANLPLAPSSPNAGRNGIIGLLLGALAVIAFVVIRYIMDDRIKGDKDVAKYLGISVLGIIPKTDSDKPESKRRATV